MTVLEAPTNDDPMGDFELILDCTVEMPGGNINFYGSEVFHNIAGDGLVFTILGGTGDYADATGTVTIAGAEIDGQQGSTLTFDLTNG